MAMYSNIVAVLALLAIACGTGAPELSSSSHAIIECNAETVGQPCDTDDTVCTREVCTQVGQDVTCALDEVAPDGTACESDGLPCTVDVCSAGSCGHEPLAAGTLCDDGSFCTTGDACDDGGACVGAPKLCDDQNGCTLDACDEDADACVNEPDVGQTCDDGDACTEGTACDADGSCTGGAPLTCEDGDACTTDACDPASGCTFAIDEGAACDDGAFCSTGDYCDLSGACVAEPTCIDGDPCTADSCDEEGASCHFEPLVGALCDDTNPCTSEDLCGVDGCEGTALADGTPCDDAGGCLVGGVCEDGVCTAVDWAEDGSTCDDGNACTVADSCDSGDCGGAQRVCDDGDRCTVDGCDPTTGCGFERIVGCDEDVGPWSDAGVAGDGGAAPLGFDGRLGGGGCGCDSSGGGAGLFWALALLALFRRRLRGVLVMLSVSLLGAPAFANGIDAQLYTPARASTGYFGVEGAAVPAAGAFDLALSFDLADDLLVFRDPDTGAPLEGGAVLDRRLGATLRAGFGIRGVAALDLILPVALSQDADVSRVEGARQPGTGLGDARVGSTLRLLDSGALRLALAAELSLPTGDVDSFGGSGGPTFTPRVVAGATAGRLRADVHAGFRWRERTELGQLAVDDELVYGAGAALELWRERLWLVGELAGAVGARVDGVGEARPFETRGGVRAGLGRGWSVAAGVGAGVGRGYGAPSVRGLVTVAYAPTATSAPQSFTTTLVEVVPEPPDSDRDGIADGEDRCPSIAEDRDGVEDADGCPDADDRMEERVVDADDACPPLTGRVADVDYGDGCAGRHAVTLLSDRIVLEERILFDTMRARVRRAGRPALGTVVELWSAHPNWSRLVIEGHADPRGLASYNQWLSEKRARRVRAELVRLGVPEGRIEIVGRGESRAESEGGDGAALAQDRRVEFVIVTDPLAKR